MRCRPDPDPDGARRDDDEQLPLKWDAFHSKTQLPSCIPTLQTSLSGHILSFNCDRKVVKYFGNRPRKLICLVGFLGLMTHKNQPISVNGLPWLEFENGGKKQLKMMMMRCQ